MSKKTIDEILSDDTKTADESSKKTDAKAPIKSKKKKFSWKKRIILAAVVVILACGGYFGFKAYDTFKNIFQNGGSIPGLLGLSTTQLKGESEDRINVLLLGIGGDNHPVGAYRYDNGIEHQTFDKSGGDAVCPEGFICQD
jgi:hypothetical protein